MEPIGTVKEFWSDDLLYLERLFSDMFEQGWIATKALQPKFNWRKFRTMFYIKIKRVSYERPVTFADNMIKILEAGQAFYKRYKEINK